MIKIAQQALLKINNAEISRHLENNYDSKYKICRK